MRNEPYIDRVFRGYGEEELGADQMSAISSAQVEEARCYAMKTLGQLTEDLGVKLPKGTAKMLFCEYVKQRFINK